MEGRQIFVGPEVFGDHDLQVLNVASDAVVVFLSAVRLGNQIVDEIDAVQSGRIVVSGVDVEVFHVGGDCR